MSRFIQLQMYKDQHTGEKSYSGSAPFVATVPFSGWKIGYYVKSGSGTTNWKITNIESTDGEMHNEDCTVTIQDDADEIRTLKGRSLRAGYQFVSTGDVRGVPEETVPAVREDCQLMSVNIEGIREYYQRKWGSGSRVLMLDKTAYIVADSPGQIDTAIRAVGGKIEAPVYVMPVPVAALDPELVH
jgi:hypothetical protein